MKEVIRRLYEFLVYIRICKPQIVVRIDGGICSQMHQYLLGFTFKKKGFVVKYDLTWFNDYGMDMINKDVRNFDLLKAFPKLDFDRVSPFILFLYRHFYNYQGHYPQSCDIDWINLVPPRLMSGYYADPEYLYSRLFQEVFKLDLSVLDEVDFSLYEEIDFSSSAAIHVRRGDIASKTIGRYGTPTPLNYFANSIDYLTKEKGVRCLYFFSDDKKYLTEQLIPFLKLKENNTDENKYRIIQNGADKGYVDMILMSKCEHIITSKGSLGKYAALLNLKKRRTVVVCSDDNQTFMLNVEQIEKVTIQP